MFKKWFGKKEEEKKQPEAPPSAPEAEAQAPPAAPEGPPPPPPVAPEAPPAGGPIPAEPPQVAKKGLWSRLKDGLAKTRAGLKGILAFRGKLDEAAIEKIEAQLYAADFGPEMVERLIAGEDGIRTAWKARTIEEADQVVGFLKNRLKALLTRRPTSLARAASGPTVYLVAGVNGTGKTTSIAKLARKLKVEGGKVILAAGDTFRAAAVEQLRIWSERLAIPIVIGKPQADPASVAFQGAERTLQEGFDYLIVDTAGRLHTQKNLMRELRKIRDVIARRIPGAPHESLLVLDATTGQNALSQARLFHEAVGVTGLILTKMDGTAKGGVALGVVHETGIPLRYIGVGEGMEDLRPFDAETFVEAILG